MGVFRLRKCCEKVGKGLSRTLKLRHLANVYPLFKPNTGKRKSDNALFLAYHKKSSNRRMCGPIFALWMGRHNNGPIEERTNVGVRGSAVNTRVVKLLPLSKKDDKPPEDSLKSEIGGSDGDASAAGNEALR